MNEKHGLTAENLLSALPEVLRNDESMYALAVAAAEVLASRAVEMDGLRIYPRIDDLPEALLDILAYDFKVDWYDCNYPLKTKRALVKSSFHVHRHMGTRGSVIDALSSIYPGSTIEEWFEYGGDPYHFRIILDVMDQLVSISNSDIVRAVDLYKSLRSHLEDNAIVYRSRTHLTVKTSCGFILYGVRLCGTYPTRATQGSIIASDIVLLTVDDGLAYTVPVSGTERTGQHPTDAVQGKVDSGGIDINTAVGGSAYRVKACGTPLGSFM